MTDIAYRWRHHHLEPVAHPQSVRVDQLCGIDCQKAALQQNTLQFVQGWPANHALLTGARGTGKSSLVKAMLTAYHDQGLRLIEIQPHDLTDLPDVTAHPLLVQDMLNRGWSSERILKLLGRNYLRVVRETRP